MSNLKTLICVLSMLLDVIACGQKLPEFLCDYKNEKVTPKENSIFILTSRSNCRGCMSIVEKIISNVDSSISWYVLVDISGITIADRRKWVFQFSRNFNLDEGHFLFAKNDSPTTGNFVGTCSDFLSPHLLLSSLRKTQLICNNELPTDEASLDDFIAVIERFFLHQN